MSSNGGPNTLTGRIAVVTGATSGIGREIARGLAARGATTVVVGRGDDRAAAVAAEIARSTSEAKVEAVGVTDLSLLSDVRRLADGLLARYPRIHILVNNAGAYYHRREVTAEGYERTFALNVLAPFVLSSRLAPRQIESAPASIVNLSSAAHRGYAVNFEDLQATERYAGFREYGRTKLELLLLTREFARRLKGTGVVVNAVHPGFVRSGFGLNNRGAVRLGLRFLERVFGRSPESGADTPVWVAANPAVPGPTGEYFANRRIATGSRASTDMDSARRLYEMLGSMTGEPPLPVPSAVDSTERSGRPRPA